MPQITGRTAEHSQKAPEKAALFLADDKFEDWSGLLALMRRAFSLHIGKVDPPNTALDCTEQDLVTKARQEALLLAFSGSKLVGCMFMRKLHSALILSRFSILPEMHGSGLARLMMAKAERYAMANCLHELALETRVELRSNQDKFGALGFKIVGGRAHKGFCKVTTLKMTKVLR
ncbi:GNAT family N-acetyltransferase [uncultured Ruegeria sp.]|uniref:GNAT family N-acetyltransferase n=1 Tax=uncultured Ruegeria sp. TaxID=259304 RepID=UPI00260E61E6|nr:GNAT family N-acetyltransferase [uncultured Ruegeria sp.]